MKLNAIASAIALACLVSGSTLVLATPQVAHAEMSGKTGKLEKTSKLLKTSKGHKGKTTKVVKTGGYG